MTNTSKPIVFFGTDYFSLHLLKALIAEGYNVQAVITKPDSRQGRGQQVVGPAVKAFAESQNIEVWQPTKVIEESEKIKALDNPAGILVSYGQIIPQEIIDLFSPGIINIHPSLLPKYRGPSPIESAIINGDEETGVSIMQLTAAMDAGPIYHQAKVTLSGTETTPELTLTLANASEVELLRVLPDILDGTLKPTPQDESKATYCSLLEKSDAHLDPNSVTAARAERHVRAYLEFPRTKIAVNNHDIIVTTAHVSESGTSVLDIKFKDGKYLSIDELIGPSGRKMTAKDFLNGYTAG